MRDFWQVAAGTGAILAGTTLFGIAGRSAQVFGPSVYRGNRSRRSLALTFDDGPSEGTLPLLDLLNAHDIKATFFQCGRNVERLPNMARAVQQAGHELGNHTYSHPRLCPRFSRKPNVHSPGFILEQLQQTQHIIGDATSIRPTLFRAPYGLRWYGLAAAQQQLGLTGVMWTVIGHDWEWPAEAVADLVLANAAAGGIICLHDGRDIQANPDTSQMLKAVRNIIPVLIDRGYRFETVSQLIDSSL